jgi:hypothetical protein
LVNTLTYFDQDNERLFGLEQTPKTQDK